MSSQQSGLMRLAFGFIVIIVIMIIAACSGGQPAEVTSTTEVLVTATALPSPTPTAGPGEVLLHLPPELEHNVQESIENLLVSLADDNGLIVKQIGADVGAELSPETRLVVSPGEVEKIAELAAENPEIGFIFMGSNFERASNLYVIQHHEGRFNQSGFLSGYTAALITADYRVGGIALDGDGLENAALQGFLNGAVFYCGLCRPTYPPFNNYPQSQFISSAQTESLLAAVQAMRDLGVTTIYLSPGLSTQELFEGLQNTGIRFIGSGIPEDPVGYTWVASISPDYLNGIQLAWEAWLAGEVPVVIEPPMTISNVDGETLSPGKLEHIEQVIQDLASGRIEPGVDPQTGEAR